MEVYAFDRDFTVDVSLGPVPLEWVTYLSQQQNCEVWAIGNQALCEEADIPGEVALREEFNKSDPISARTERLRLLEQLFDSAEKYVVVDDIDLTRMEPTWEYYHPEDFVKSYESYFIDKL